MFKSFQKTLMSESGKYNTNSLFIVKEEGKEHVGIHFPNEACFATTCVGLEYRDEYDNEDITHMLYDIQNPKKTYAKGMTKTSEAASLQMARVIFNLPYLRKFYVNKSFKDAYENGLIIEAKDGMTQAEMFLGPYLFRHIWERSAYLMFIELRRKYKLTIHEATMLSFYIYGHGNVSKGLAYPQGGGHSAVCLNAYNDFGYFLKFVYKGPTFPKKGLWTCSPPINQTTGGTGTYEKAETRWPKKTIGEGFQAKTWINLDEVVSKMNEYKKGLQNVT